MADKQTLCLQLWSGDRVDPVYELWFEGEPRIYEPNEINVQPPKTNTESSSTSSQKENSMT